MLDQFSGTIEKIYAAAGDGRQWGNALRSIEDLTGSTGVVIDLVPKSSAPPQTLAGSFTRAECAEYAEHYMANCPRIRYAVEHPPGTQFDYLFMSEADMDRDPVYEWYGSYGLRYHVASLLTETPAYRIAFSLQRSRIQGHASPEDIRVFDLLKPHVGRALALADQLGTLRTFDRFSSAILESLPQAVFALDSNGGVQFANRPAMMMLSRGDGLCIDGGRLMTALSSEQPRLDSLVRGALSPLPAACCGWLRVSRPSGRLPLALFAAPLALEDDELATVHAKVVVLVHDLADRPPADPTMLTSLYELTQTEARLASALSAGHSVESAAALLHMQPATARSHLKAIFRKTGTSRQQDLVRLLTSLSSLSPAP